MSTRDAVKDAAAGRWDEILRTLAPAFAPLLAREGKNGPCPLCGGKDRARMFKDYREKGGFFCNQCAPKGCADGFGLLEHALKLDFPAVLKMVAGHLGINGGNGSPPKVQEYTSGLEDVTAWLREQAEARNEGAQEPLQEALQSMPPPAPAPTPRAPQEVERWVPSRFGPWIYTDAAGANVARISRQDPVHAGGRKKFVQQRWERGEWLTGTKGLEIPLYKLPGVRRAIAAGEPTYLVEGEKCADALLALGLCATTNPGGSKAWRDWHTTELVGAHVVLLPDNDEAGAAHRQAVEAALKTKAKSLRVLALEGLGPKEDVYDWLAAGHTRAELEALVDALHVWPASVHLLFHPQPEWPLSGDKVVDDINSHHFFTMVGGKSAIVNEYYDPESENNDWGLSPPTSFFHRYANQIIELPPKEEGGKPRYKGAGEYWFTHKKRRQYLNGMKFYPGLQVPDGWYNMFRGLDYEPIRGDTSLYWAHVFEVIADENEDRYLFIRKWMAHIFQQPWDLPRTSLVIVGEEGAGKGAWVDRLGELLGNYFFALSRLDRVLGKFNAHLANRLLIYANEATWGGDKQSEGALKALVTDRFSDLEKKGYDVIRNKNYARLVINSNEDWAIPQGKKDRRFLYARCSDRYIKDRGYFNRLYAATMPKAHRHALMFDLLTEDLSGWDSIKIPGSQEATINKLRTAGTVAQWWHSKLLEGVTVSDHQDELCDEWNRAPVKMFLHRDYTVWCQEHRKNHIVADSIFTKELQKVSPITGARHKRRVTIREHGQTRTQKELSVYSLPELAECRRVFEEAFNAGPEMWQGSPDDCPF